MINDNPKGSVLDQMTQGVAHGKGLETRELRSWRLW